MPQFSKDNQPDHSKGRQSSKRLKLVAALEKSGLTEEEFYTLYVEKAVAGLKDNTFHSANEIMDRLYRPPKQTMEHVEFELPTGEEVTPLQQAQAVLNATSQGVIPPDVGVQFVNMIQSTMVIQDITELAAEVEAIKEAMEKDV